MIIGARHSRFRAHRADASAKMFAVRLAMGAPSSIVPPFTPALSATHRIPRNRRRQKRNSCILIPSSHAPSPSSSLSFYPLTLLSALRMSESLTPNKYMDAEWRVPPVEGIVDPTFYNPFVFYILMFLFIGWCVRTFAWQGYTGFKNYRLCNLTVCLIHSVISGGWALGFMLWRPHVMFKETLHWYEPWAAHLPVLSMGYFVSDSIDMLRHELSRWTVELLVHHAASIFVFASAVLPHKFIPYAYWALLMEVNRLSRIPRLQDKSFRIPKKYFSVFLHIRSSMQITGASVTKIGIYTVVKYINLATFVVFRFAVQIWQINWGFAHRSEFHTFYAFVAVFGGAFFFVINVFLFVRVLASDGFLGEFGRRHTAINRDVQGSLRISGDTKNS